MKKIIGLAFAITLVIPALVSAQALLNSNSQTWSDGACLFNIKSGWNLVPLAALHDASSGYWNNYRSNLTTCGQDVARDVWMWSPVAGNYENFVIDDWVSPETRNNQFLTNEYSNNYFHVYYGSAWVYSKEDCTLARNVFPPGMAAQYTGDQQNPSKNAYFDDLTLKSGWNFVAIDTWMMGKSLADVFNDCTVLKVNSWNPVTRQWNLGSSDMDSAANNLDSYSIPMATTMDFDNVVLGTVLVKVSGDCKISMEGTSGPPPLPE